MYCTIDLILWLWLVLKIVSLENFPCYGIYIGHRYRARPSAMPTTVLEYVGKGRRQLNDNILFAGCLAAIAAASAGLVWLSTASTRFCHVRRPNLLTL